MSKKDEKINYQLQNNQGDNINETRNDLIMDRHLLLLASGLGITQLRQESYPRGEKKSINRLLKDVLIDSVSIPATKYSDGSTVEYHLTKAGMAKLKLLSKELNIELINN